MKVGVFYFGCKVNQYDLARITTALRKSQVDVVVGDVGDINIIAGCVVTHKAEREGIKLIKRIRKHYPFSRVYLMGCLAVHRGNELKQQGLIDDYFLTTDDEVRRLYSILRSVLSIENPHLPDRVLLLEHSRAFLKVQDGCSYRCAFCLSRNTRISLYSYDLHEKIEELRKLFLSGISEVVITGINLMLWTDGIHDVSYLLLKLADIAYDFGGRIRISSVYPDKNIFRLTPLWQHPGVANHLHLSVQSGSAKVLDAMNRVNYIPILDEYLPLVRDIDRGFGLSGDFIVGFPGETEDDFVQTLSFVERHLFNKLHVFPYSPREGTPAYHMKTLPPQVVKDRGKRLRDLGDKLKQEFVRSLKGQGRPAVFLHGKDKRVLFDNYLYMKYEQEFSGIKNLHIDPKQIL